MHNRVAKHAWDDRQKMGCLRIRTFHSIIELVNFFCITLTALPSAMVEGDDGGAKLFRLCKGENAVKTGQVQLP